MAGGYPGYINPYLQAAYPQAYQAPVPQYQYPMQTTAPYPQQVQPQVQQAAPQSMTPPTIHAEIIQVKSMDEIEKFPVNAGTTQLFQLSDDSAFVIKAVYPNGQSEIDVYAKQPKKPTPPPIDPAQFVTWDALGDALEEWAEKRNSGAGRGRKKRTDESEQPQES